MTHPQSKLILYSVINNIFYFSETSSNGTRNDTDISTTTSADSSTIATWIIVVICVAALVVLVVIIVMVVWYVRRRNKKMKDMDKGMGKKKKIKVCGPSMESVDCPPPNPGPQMKTDVTQKTVTVDAPVVKNGAAVKDDRAQKSKVVPIAPKKKSKIAALKTAEEKTKGELSFTQVAIPTPEAVDPSKPYSKLFKCEFIRGERPTAPKPIYPPTKNIIPFLTQKIDDPDVPTSLYTPDCLLQQALRQLDIQDRAAMLHQAV